MAIDDKSKSIGATGRRFFFGTNVLIVIVLTVFVVIALNWLGNRHNYRSDLAGGFASHRLSQRTQLLIKDEDKLRITTVYTSDEPESDRKKYFPKLQDFCEEMRQCNKKIEIAHLHTGDERAKLRDRVQSKFGTAAKEYNDVLTLALSAWSELKDKLNPQQQAIDALLQGDSWLAGFSTLANIRTVVGKDLENVEETRAEVEDLVHGEGIPRFKEANDKVKSANDELKRHLEDIQKWIKEMDKLVKVLTDSNSEFAQTTRQKVQELTALTKNLQMVAGDPSDASIPEDPKPVLQKFAKEAAKLANWLVDESARVDKFVEDHPAIRQHPKWQVRQQIFVFELPSILSQIADLLGGNSRQLRQILAQEDVPLDQLQSAVRQLRSIALQCGQKLDGWTTQVLSVLNEGGQIDEPSKSFLAAGGAGELFKEVLDKLNEVGTKISELPELELDEIAKRLQEDNIVVVESNDDIRVVSFDEAWPAADPMEGRFRSEDEEPGRRRVFDGDGAISSAILSMQQKKPFATVIMVGYETQPPPQMRQFQRPSEGPIPLDSLDTLKQRLEKANFVVKQWNLGAEGEEAKKPEPEQGTEPIYIFLPPAPSPPNFMMRQQPQKSFGEQELAKVREVLAEKERALFLAVYEPPSMFGPPPEYAYGKMLQDDWGIEVQSDRRVIRGVVDQKEPGRYAINLIQWYYMQLSYFTSHPIGEPLKARRVLMREVCPVTKMDTVPAGVTVSPVLNVPAMAHDFWAEKDIDRIIRALHSGERRGTFTKSEEAWNPPFSVILAAENEQKQSKVVIMGMGLSLRDDYLTQRVMRIEGKHARLVTDPPPTENLDLLVNTVYWLGGRQDLIASGPAEVPMVAVIEEAQQRNLWLISMGWAFAVLIVGGMVMLIRRK